MRKKVYKYKRVNLSLNDEQYKILRSAADIEGMRPTTYATREVMRNAQKIVDKFIYGE